jgi:magnesium-protoporphyrin O-methyltransferase
MAREGGGGNRDDRDDPSSFCGPGCACAVGNEFGESTAKREAARYRKHGPETTTRWLLDGLQAGAGGDLRGLSVLDIGAGVGAVHLTLLEAGAATAIDVDGSPAFIDAAKREALRAGVAHLVRHEAGDFVELAGDIEPADIVALDRVVCCYPDMRSLVRLSAEHARRRYGLVYPRDSWWIRGGSAVANAALRLVRQRTRIFIHRTADVEAIVESAGLSRHAHRQGVYWQVAIFERTSAAGASSAGTP